MKAGAARFFPSMEVLLATAHLHQVTGLATEDAGEPAQFVVV
jgi:hypothetical protein